MSKQRGGGNPSWGLLLLIPAVVIIAKGARRRRAMWESGWGPTGTAGHGHRPFTHFGGGEGTADERGAFRLPPRIEWMLDSWHTRAHQQQEAAESTTV
jgi:hypothetical protein